MKGLTLTSSTEEMKIQNKFRAFADRTREIPEEPLSEDEEKAAMNELP